MALVIVIIIIIIIIIIITINNSDNNTNNTFISPGTVKSMKLLLTSRLRISRANWIDDAMDEILVLLLNVTSHALI